MIGLLKDKVIIVTGAGSGMGKVAAEHFAAAGAAVALAGRTLASVQQAADAICAEGGRAIAVRADVAQFSDCQSMVASTIDAFGRLDGAFNNAGVDGPLVAAADYPEEAFDEVIAINLKGVWNAMRAEIPAMLAAGGGSIVNNASGLASVGQFGMVAYCASKAGVVGATKAAALDYGAQGIRINALSPGVVETPMMTAQMEAHPGVREMLLGRHPIGRLGLEIEIAEAAAWMLSDHSRFMLGANIAVDGGYTAV
jgi:A-factor type gamma-butyrolactone 1'-reductase (1S-forming)